MTIPNGTLIMLEAVIATNITPRAIIKQRCTGGPVVGAGDRVARPCWCPLPQCKQEQELKQGDCAGISAHIPNAMHKVPFLYCTW